MQKHCCVIGTHIFSLQYTYKDRAGGEEGVELDVEADAEALQETCAWSLLERENLNLPTSFHFQVLD